ncbi:MULTISPECIES: hypothetical protein [Streptomyces griseus group]|uniref:hypothetical protein n=1 Tax=Streptomyces griseus group TaxID=629295 RepID=UPI00067C3AA8|nr:hypothetical protein [Streptomyces baarnensis]
MHTPTNPDGTSLPPHSCDLIRQPVVPPPAQPPGLLSTRTALILFAALIAGVLIGVLTYLSTRDLAAAVLAGLAAGGVCIPALHGLIKH